MSLKFPYAKFTYIINLPQSELENRLNSIIGERKLLNLSKPEKPFYGSLNADGFKILPVLYRRRNSFAPVIIGKFSTQNGEPALKITMRLHLLVALFMIYFLGFALVFGVVSLVNKSLFEIMLAAFLFICGYIMTSFFFWLEAKRAANIFDEILKS